MNYLIIGNGAAGTGAAEKLRRLDPDGVVTILTAEPYCAYSKCLLADYLSGRLAEKSLRFKEKDFYTKNRINICFNHKVENIDFILRKVRTSISGAQGSSKRDFRYDRLLIASGSKPLIPKIVGLNRVQPYFLNTLADAEKIRVAAKRARKAVVVGAGFVGLEIAFNLRKNGLEVTLVEKAPRILPSQLDETAARLIVKGLEAEGIRVILNCGVSEAIRASLFDIKRLLNRNHLQGMVLENGEFVEADLVLIAAGSIPNLEFLKPGDLEVKRGIIVDRHLMTSVPDVYAAGDVVESIDAVTGERSLSPIWPNAVIQGEYAAYNMAGVKREFSSLVSMQNAAEFREIPLISMGIVEINGPGFQEFVDYRPEKGIYRKLIFKDNIIVGMIFLGDISNSGVVGALIKNRTDIGKIKINMLNPNFGYSEVVYMNN